MPTDETFFEQLARFAQADCSSSKPILARNTDAFAIQQSIQDTKLWVCDKRVNQKRRLVVRRGPFWDPLHEYRY